MSKTITPKVANIRLKEGRNPITVSGLGYASGDKKPMRFPTLARQKNGWHSQEAKRIIREYGDRYEMITENFGGGN